MARDSRPWIRVSVDMWRHPKITQLTAAQFRTLIALWSLAMEYRTDGTVDVKFARSQGLTMGSLRAIADTGLGWFDDTETTFHLHDYLDHQSSAAQLEEMIDDLSNQMLAAAEELKFELAARLRDEVQDLKKELRAMQKAGHA